MQGYTFNPDMPPREAEIAVLSWLRDNMPKGNKKLISLSRRIRPHLPMYIQRSLCDVIEDPRTKDAQAWMKKVFIDMEIFPKIVAKMLAEGNHGMIMDKGKMYGFNLLANAKWLSGKETEKWHDDDERDIADEAVQAWMVKHFIRHFDGKVVLFDEFGFSGIARESGWSMPDKLWFEEVKPARDAERARKKTSDEISKLINGTRKHVKG